ncbi:hypothetical protein ACWEHA_29480 [Amycolatopsis nivea]
MNTQLMGYLLHAGSGFVPGDQLADFFTGELALGLVRPGRGHDVR